MTRRTPSSSKRVAIGIAITVLAIGGWFLIREWRNQEEQIAPLPPVRETPFANANLDAEFVGVQSCAACHPDEHETYLETAHSLALSDVDTSSEPPDGRFHDESSGRDYDVFRRDGKLWHRESFRTSDETETVLAELPMRYGIGSGRYSRSYLAERDGFLVESPVTWYAARPGWAVSPGYEIVNTGFERPIVRECINCHVGRADSADGALQRFDIHSQVIDCERCHGPGSHHVAHWNEVETAPDQDTSDGDSEQDFTIVNPGRLSRDDAEAICAQCHFHPSATVELRGRRLSDFRPGMKLNDFCVHYGLAAPDQQMRVVGHVEQLRLSPCYQGSVELTCTTCHDPHARPSADEAYSYFRSTCLACHDEQSCGVSLDERSIRFGRDDCVGCHMPTSPTDIPHFAFTHHRIGIHAEESPEGLEGDAPPESVTLELVALDEVGHLPLIEQQRCRGLGYLQAMANAESPNEVAHYQLRAISLLEMALERGLQDPEVDAAMARLNWRVNPDNAADFARSALARDDASPESRVTALYVLASTLVDQGEEDAAIAYLEELVTLRLRSEDWYILSHCYESEGRTQDALRAAVKAAEIAPQYPQLQQRIAALLEASGEEQRAQEHRDLAEQLSKLPQAGRLSGID